MAERPRETQLPGTHTREVRVAAQNTGVANEIATWTNDTGATVRITAVGYTPDAAVTGIVTNFFSLQARNKGTDGTGG